MSSSLFNSILCQQQKELLIVSYCRLHHMKQFTLYDHPIPNELIGLIYEFVDLSTKWTLCGDQLVQFLSAKNGEAIQGPSFIIHDIKFNLYLTPNGINESEQGYVQFLAAPIFTSPNIDSITLWYSLHCKQTNSEWNNTTIFYWDDTDCASWPVHTLPLSQITSRFRRRTSFSSSSSLPHSHKNGASSSLISSSSSSSLHTVSNNKCSSTCTATECEYIIAKEDRLDFSCYIDVLNIEYKHHRQPSYFNANQVYMNKYAKFQWNIYDEQLQEFRYCVWGKYYFQHINANWMLECAPNGQSSDDEGNVNVLLSLLRLPQNVQAVMVHMILNCDYNDIRWDFRLRFDLENNSYGWPEGTMLSSYLLSTTSITFTVEMTILEIYDRHNREIPQEQWHEYGIIDNKQELNKQFDLEFKQRHRAKLKQQQRMIQMKVSTFMQMAAAAVPSSSSSVLVQRKIINTNRSRSELKNVRLMESNGDQQQQSHSEPQLNGTELLVELLLAASHGLSWIE